MIKTFKMVIEIIMNNLILDCMKWLAITFLLRTEPLYACYVLSSLLLFILYENILSILWYFLCLYLCYIGDHGIVGGFPAGVLFGFAYQNYLISNSRLIVLIATFLWIFCGFIIPEITHISIVTNMLFKLIWWLDLAVALIVSVGVSNLINKNL